MSNYDVIGKRFGLLTACELAGTDGKNKLCKCRCDCGKSHTTRISRLINGTTKSCGCMKYAHCTTHGLHDHPLHSTWKNMRRRCYSKSNPGYKNYGGRGISVCKRWRESFAAFVEDVGPKPSELHSLDRINNDGNYEPSNVRWATATEQRRNSRAITTITFGGVTKSLIEWSEELGIPYETIRERVGKGWSAARILKKAPTVRLFTYGGRTATLPQLSRISGVHYQTVVYRLKSGWSLEDALSKRGRQ